MACLLPADCLAEIFENLDNDKATLSSCLLVSRVWCEVSVRILWRDIGYLINRPSAILSTLVACLPNESKERLHENKIFISTPTLKPPLFDYVAFCRVLSVNNICHVVNDAFRNKPI